MYLLMTSLGTFALIFIFNFKQSCIHANNLCIIKEVYKKKQKKWIIEFEVGTQTLRNWTHCYALRHKTLINNTVKILKAMYHCYQNTFFSEDKSICSPRNLKI